MKDIVRLDCGFSSKEGFAMDLLTQYYYSNHAEQLSRAQVECRTEGVVGWFDFAFPEGSSVLDIGSGSGAHLARLLDRRHEAIGVEPCQAFIAGAEAMYPEVRGRIIEDSLPRLQDIPDNRFDGVLCSAVLMHVPEEQLFEAAYNLRRVLKPGGTFLVSLPLDREGLPLRGRDTRGLLFNGLSPLRLELILSRMGFVCVRRGESPDIYDRAGRSMGIRLFVLDEKPAQPDLTRVREALSGDDSTTYCAALIRALAETGLTRYNSVRCLPDETVAVPFGVIADQLLEYYWPLVEGDGPIAQFGPLSTGAIQAVSFMGLLSEMACRFDKRGGLDGFLIARRGSGLDGEDFDFYRKLMSRFCDTIRLGAALHARAFEDEPLFTCDSRSNSLILERPVWQAFSLQGARIRDAATLRWAALTELFSGGEVDREQALKLLIRPPYPERQVTDVRRACLDDPDLVCVWTGEKIQPGSLEIRRAIPFVCWRNNDLWNLFPTDGARLSGELEGLPGRKLLMARKRAILDHWDRLYRAFPERFRNESARLAGAIITHQRNWPQRLFGLLCEAVEFTARQLGTPRWEP